MHIVPLTPFSTTPQKSRDKSRNILTLFISVNIHTVATHTSKHAVLTAHEALLGRHTGFYLAAPSLKAEHRLAKEQIAKGVADGLVDKRRGG